MTGFDEAEPASRNDMFISAPKNAANPVSSPRIKPIPTAISPNVMTYVIQLSAPLSIRNWMKARYHSYVIAGRPSSGIATAFCQ